MIAWNNEIGIYSSINSVLFTVGEGGSGVDGQTRPNSGSEDTNDYSYGYDG